MDSSEGKTNGNDTKLTSETSEEVFGQVISLTDCNELSKNDEMSQDFHEPSIFSQETPEFDMQSTEVINAVSSENSGISSDVTAVVPTMDLVILETETDSTSEKGSVITLSDSGDGIKNDHNSLIRRKSSQMSPVPYKKTCLEDSRHSESTTNIENSSNITEEAIKSTARIHTPVAIRSSPRNSPQKNINRHQLLQPARRLKKSVSVDNDIETSVSILSNSPSKDFIPTSAKKISKLTLRRKRALSVDVKHSHSDILPEKYSQDELEEYFGCKTAKTPNVDDELLSGRKNPIQPIIEESQNDICYPNIDDTQNFVPPDSQNIQLFLSPTIETSCLLSADALENEPLLSQDVSDTPVDVVLLSDSNRAPTDISNNDSHKSPQSLNLDSPFNSENSKNPIIKAKPYLSNGYSSSTPENAPENVLLKKSFHLSDSETDNTPPFTNFGKQPDSQLSNSSKSNCSTINSSISPLNNGLMNGSHVSNSSQPSVPIFHIQMYGDENDDFLSMFIVKTSNDMGAQTLREYQRLSKRLSTDAYAGDVSKSTSPSSITSGGLLQLPPHPRSSFMSTTSSSSTSSSRTSDGAFIIPQRPKRNFSFHSPTTVKGWLALRQTLSDIVSKLADLDPTEEVMRSPNKNGEAKSNQIFSANNSKSPESKKDDMDSRKNTSNEYSRSTPKSSKKKIQTKTKRILSKIKKTELSVTNEESQEMIESISSPEIVPTEKCEEFQTPSRFQKSNIETSGTPKTTPRGRKPKNNSLLVTPIDNPFPLSHQEQAYPRGTMVLAKWRDKKYYSGKVLASTDNNKYEIEFYDGQIKTLLDEFIIFGNMTELPLKGQSVYTKVDDATYEPSLVLAVEKNENGEVLYKCTTDRDSMVAVKASDIYLTEDQAKSFQETIPPKSPHSAPGTPRRRINRDLDLNNIIHEPRSARLRDKTTPKLLGSPSSPKAGPSSIRRGPSKRLESESSEGGDSRASSTAPEDVDGLQPETQTTPRKTKGIKVNYVARNLIAIKGNSKQKSGKESKVKFETEEEITETLGPIPPNGSTLFSGLHFLLSCTDMPPLKVTAKTTSPFTGSDSYRDSSGKEDEIMLAKIPFMKQRLEQQLEKGGGTVYSRFEDIPKNKYGSCRLIVSRPCQTGKFIMCLAANIKSLSHLWVIQCCKSMKILDYDSYALPTGFSIERERMIASHERSCTKPFKDKLVLICCDNENFTKFWDRVCCLAGANTKILTEDDMDLRNAIAIITESNCPTIIRNKAEYEGIPLVSTTWIVQCLIEGKLLNCNGNIRYRFDYIDE